MLRHIINTKIKRFSQKLNGINTEYDLSVYQSIVVEIKRASEQLKSKSDEQLRQLSRELKQKVQHNNIIDDGFIEAFALVREAIWRTLKLQPFDVQLIGGLVMQHGKLAEMQTGEGKTLTAVFPAYLNALNGKGVHVLTFNDYLARRDAAWMGPMYDFLGLRVGHVQQGMSHEQRKEAYGADITYVTAKEAGFDFLRDSLCYDKRHLVQRPFQMAIVDEADSILIDEARIPLVIAGTVDDIIPETCRVAEVAAKLRDGTDFEFDEYTRNINLSDAG